MGNRQRITAIGIGGAVLMFEVLQPSPILTVPLLLIFVFMIAYGTVPNRLRRWADGAGMAAPYLSHGLDKVDELFAKIVPEIRSQSSGFSELLAQSVGYVIRVQQEQSEEALILSVNQWIEDTRALIEEAVGGAEAARFMSNAGIVSFSGSGKIKIAIERRLQRLNELIERLDRISIKPDFNQEKWEQKFNGTR